MSYAGRRPSVLIGMLHVGEPSVPRVRARIREQVDVDVELLEIAHQTKWEAHRRLFDAFSTAGAEHDALVKVDGDMEIVEPRLLHAIGTLFRLHPGLDHLILGVDDWYSGQKIQGMGAWRRGVQWTSPPLALFTDHAENTARTKLKVMEAGRPLVLHAVDPTDEQAVRYGLQRGLKAGATRKASRIGRLLDVIDHAVESPTRGRLIAVAAIGFAITTPLAAHELLDAARDNEADLGPVLTRLAERDLCSTVREQIAEAFAAAEQDQSPLESRPGPVERALARIRDGLGRLRGCDAPSAEPDSAKWRRDFLALLAADQPNG